MSTDTTQDRISLHPHTRRVRVWDGDTLLADSTGAIELRERGYPSRQYLPESDVHMAYLIRSATVTHCPFKGDATYYSTDEHPDIAWQYANPLTDMDTIAGRLAFDDTALDVRVETA
ncbi:DUF427 domain-containing protein [Chromohalobacter sp. HP20-39]|uniref:DUF427 domain-containing protein n=1 Tax=Chromohalobacter sp. HP20-39 TaxID=3079306 RepID=UPI00294B6304|nr:DUF427 domain-containing protein [Chromohalobacter sp. HP20-39]MDV6318244.1 DUF427 domain-containing protein [Chromohalobacter sp. HP20-39]